MMGLEDILYGALAGGVNVRNPHLELLFNFSRHSEFLIVFNDCAAF